MKKNTRKRTLKTEANESDFRQLLREVKANRLPADVLLEHEVFKNRLRLLSMTYARTAQDAEDLASDVSIKVWQRIQNFKPDPRSHYDGFFLWLRGVTRKTFLDSRRRELELDDRSIEDIDIADPQTDVESSFLYKEVIAEFEKRINALPRKERLAVVYYLQGLTLRETSEKMRQAGFPSSHVAVGKWIRDALSDRFSKAGPLQTIPKRARVTKVRAARAKREFHTIVEQAIDSGISAITSDRDSHPLTRERSKTSKTKRSNSRPGWQSANDLLKSMQSRASKEGIHAAFESSPEDLGRAAVEYAIKTREVPVSSLTTLLMATSTANVVGRVMNLTEDA